MKPAPASSVRDVLLLLLAYFVVGMLGLRWATVSDNVTLVWLPAGIAVAALYRWGPRLLAGVWLGSFGIGVVTGLPVWTAGVLGIANILGPLAAVWILRQGSLDSSFARPRDILLLVAAAAAGMVASATIGVVTLTLAGIQEQATATAWLFWWAGDVMGVITIAPLVLSANREQWRASSTRRVEAVSVILTLALMGWAIFFLNGAGGSRALSLAFVPLPVIAWAALRFGPGLTSLALTELALVAAAGTANNTGPFAGSAQPEGAVLLLLFIATSVALGWLITALQGALLRATGTWRQLEQALDDASLGVLLGAPDGAITYTSAGFTTLTGYSTSDVVKESLPILKGPRTDAESARALAAALHAGQRFEGDILSYRKDGTPFWGSLLVSPGHDDSGEPTAFVGVLRDVTDRKRTEVVNAAERDVFECLASGAPLAEALSRLAEGFEEVYPGARVSILLLEAGGTRLRRGAAPQLPEAFCRALEGVELGPTVGACGAAVFTRKLAQAPDIASDPHWKDYKELAIAHGLRACASLPIISSSDEVLGTMASYREVPHLADAAEIATLERCARFAALAIERHELVRSLDESRNRLQTLVANLPGMAYRCLNDTAWTMSYVSDGCEAITGYRSDELEGNRVASYGDLVHPDDREWLWAKCQASLDAHTPCVNEYRLIDRQGRERWVSERASGNYDADGALLSIDGFVQDITESRRVAVERARLERKMLETQKLESLGVLAGGIAHDFNNILTGILGNASLGVSEATPGAPLEEYFRDIAEAARRAADLCRQMLAYAGKGRFVVRKLDLSHLVETTTQMMQISISKSAVLRYQLARDLPPVEVDATQIRQVIMNLVINASEAIGERSGVISISTGLAHVDRAYLTGTLASPDIPAGDYVFLEVSDSGVGMSPETQARIFDPFFTTKFTGRGLGLAAVLGIVRGHNGALKLYSEPGRGTTFKLLFPAVGGTSEPALQPADTAAEWQGSGTVLVVDDEETVRSTTARMLRRMGFEVVLAADGNEAVDLFRAAPDRFAVVLLDLTMPHRNGEQTFAELRQLRGDVRVVLMSGFSEQEALVRFPGKGLASFLQKPFSNEALRDMLQALFQHSA